MSMTMLVLVDEIIKTLKKMIFDNRRITVREIADDVGYRSPHAKHFLRMF